MNKRLDLDLSRDAIIFGDLRNLSKLKDLNNPTEDDVRMHASAVRRLLLDGELDRAAGRRRIPVLFHPTDSNPLVRAARNNKTSAFSLWGIDVFGVQFSGVSLNAGNTPLNVDFDPDRLVSLKLGSFLKQVVAMSPPLVRRSTVHPPKELSPSVLLTRLDILQYVANKIGGVHYDPSPSGALTEEKIQALGRIRRAFQIELKDGAPVIGVKVDCFEEEQSSSFSYQPEKIDAVYLEFIAIIDLLLSSPEVFALCLAIENDLKKSG
jgi:hypothetical protein